MIAHQRKIRDQLAAIEAVPIGVNLALDAATVRPIGYKDALGQRLFRIGRNASWRWLLAHVSLNTI